MTQKRWSAVDEYIVDSLLMVDTALDEALRSNAEASLPAIDVAPNQGKLLHLIARMCNTQRILEIGTLGGYSTIWLGRALPPDGKLITLEFELKHASVAAVNIARAGLSSQVEIRVGPALESLAQMLIEDVSPFDMIFIDADKPNNPSYLEWAIRFSRPGTVIVTDNVIRNGEVIDPASLDSRVQGVRKFFEMLGSDSRLDATALQTVGSKGYDGFALALVK